MSTIPADPHQWRPQQMRIVRGTPAIANPIAEPFWNGIRILVVYRESHPDEEWGSLDVVHDSGRDLGETAGRALDQLRRSIRSPDAVIDGIITVQAERRGEGTAVVPVARRGSVGRLILGGPPTEVDFDSPASVLRSVEPAFVALDLLRVDGQTLFDVPLLERKRLLEGLIEQSELVRISPWVTPPIGAWYATWRSMGFKGAMLKGANSRYTPGGITDEWAILEKMPRE